MKKDDFWPEGMGFWAFFGNCFLGVVFCLVWAIPYIFLSAHEKLEKALTRKVVK